MSLRYRQTTLVCLFSLGPIFECHWLQDSLLCFGISSTSKVFFMSNHFCSYLLPLFDFSIEIFIVVYFFIFVWIFFLIFQSSLLFRYFIYHRSRLIEVLWTLIKNNISLYISITLLSNFHNVTASWTVLLLLHNSSSLTFNERLSDAPFSIALANNFSVSLERPYGIPLIFFLILFYFHTVVWFSKLQSKADPFGAELFLFSNLYFGHDNEYSTIKIL